MSNSERDPVRAALADRLSHAMTTMCNDDISRPYSGERRRHSERYEAMAGALEYLRDPLPSVPDCGAYVLMPREATRSMTMAGCDMLPSCEHVFGHAGEILKNAYRKMVEVAALPPTLGCGALVDQWRQDAKRHMEAQRECETGDDEWYLHQTDAERLIKCATELSSALPPTLNSEADREAVALLFSDEIRRRAGCVGLTTPLADLDHVSRDGALRFADKILALPRAVDGGAADELIQRHASAYVARGGAISEGIIADCKASREALRAALSHPQTGDGDQSAPLLTAPHNSGERLPNSDAAGGGADTCETVTNIRTASEIESERLARKAALPRAVDGGAVSIPLEMLRQLHDKLEELPDWAEAGTDTWILYHQIETFIYPERGLSHSRSEG